MTIRSAALFFALATASVAVSQARSIEPIAFNIEAQSLGTALQAFSAQAHIQVLRRDEEVSISGVSAPAVSGAFIPEQALSRLLEGSGLTFEFINAKTVRLTPRALAQADSPAESSSQKPIRTAQAQPTASARTEGQREPLEEIVVTAQKREERLRDVPISISVLGGAELDRSTFEGTGEALNSVPGVATVEGNQGAGTNIIVRGVSAQGPLLVGGNAIAYYLDSVPFGLSKTAFSPDSNAYDLARVEVLRGPQGTLYGSSALNGVVRVLTQDANLNKFEFKARGSAAGSEDGGENYRGDAALNVPLIEGKLAARAVVGYQDLGGWIDRPAKKDANDAELRNWRLKLNALPAENFSVGLSAWSSRDDYGGPPAGDDDNKRNSLLAEPLSIDTDAYGLNLGYDFSGVSVTSMTSYLDYSNHGTLDIYSLVGGAFSAPFFTGFDSSIFAQEINLRSTGGGTWRWSAGGIYRDGSNRTQEALSGAVLMDQKETSQSYAVYGELTRLFMNGRWELTAGARYFEDKVAERELPSGSSTSTLYRASDKFSKTTPRVVLTWHPDSQKTLYASFSEGFRSGVIQDISTARLGFGPIGPDTLKNYEVGAKGALLDGRVEFDAAVFYLDWQKIQQQTSAPSPIFPDIQTTVLINGTSASGAGIDVGLSARPVEGLTVSLNGSWNDLSMDGQVISAGVVLFDKGERPTFSPELTVGGSVAYQFPLTASGLKGRFSAGANYISPMDFRTVIGTLQIARSDAMLIGRTSFALEFPNRLTATLFADNVNNETGSPSRTPYALGIADWDSRLRPRTIGVQFDYQF